MAAGAIVACCVALIPVVRVLGLTELALGLSLSGVVIGFLCSPIANWLEDHGMGRALAAFAVLVALLATLILVGVRIIPPLLEQLIHLLQSIPGHISRVQTDCINLAEQAGLADNGHAEDALNQIISGLFSSENAMDKISSDLFNNAADFVNNTVAFSLGLVLVYWFAKDYPAIAQEAVTLVREKQRDSASLRLAVMSRSMLITSGGDGVLCGVGLALSGHPYAGFVGAFCGLAHFVPVIGPLVSRVIAVPLALFESPALAIWFITVVVAQNVTDNLVSPLVMQSAVKVHPVLSLVGIIVDNALGGIVGMILAIPLTAAVVYYVETRTGQQPVSYDGAIFKGTPYHDPEGNIVPSFDVLDDDKFFQTTWLIQIDNVNAHSVHRHTPAQAGHALRETGFLRREEA
ncbi:MAG: AI-2E family transporter [Coriobacteriaceae bacterium]